MDAANQQLLTSAVAGASADGGEEVRWEDEVWRERCLLMVVINNLRTVADAALDRAETAEEAAKAAERSEAAAVRRWKAAESAQTMQSSIEARICDSVVAKVHEAVRAASEEAIVELRAAAAELRWLRACPPDQLSMNFAGFVAESEAVTDVPRISATEMRKNRYFQHSSIASDSAASSSAGVVLQNAEQEGRDVQPPFVMSQGLPRPEADTLGRIRANLDTLSALVKEPSLESLVHDSVAPSSHRENSASAKKIILQTVEKSAPERCVEEGQEMATTTQTIRNAKVMQHENCVSRNKAEPLRVGWQQKKVRDFVSKLERQREFQQSSLDKFARSTRATIAEPHTGSKHGTSKAALGAATATRASCCSKDHV